MSNTWNYIRDNNDIKDILDKYSYFHDSCISHMDYVSGAKVDNEGNMECEGQESFRLNITFQSQIIKKSIEMQFIGLRRINLIGYKENYFCDMSSCYLALYNDYIIWADDDSFNLDNPYGNKLLEEGMTSFIVADELRWRFIES
ncbi:MAG: hypothetical protein KIC47_08595 [Clostridium sp.]|nr:hypothetical protein [Clostridium sp.]